MPVPICTLSVLAMSALAYASPGVAAALIFDRVAILDGQVWRIVTGHTVHFSTTHLILDVLAFALAGGVIEYKGYARAGVLYLVMAAIIGVSLLLFEPGMYYYGGLSGLACGALVYLAWSGLRGSSALRLVSVTLLVVVFSKIAVELYSGQSLLQLDRHEPFTLMPLSHLLGALSASLMFIYVTAKPRVLQQ